MNNNECCKGEAEPRKSIARYEQETMDCLVETRDTLRSIYMTITGIGNGNGEDEDREVPGNLLQNVLINRELAMQIKGMSKTINEELFGE